VFGDARQPAMLLDNEAIDQSAGAPQLFDNDHEPRVARYRLAALHGWSVGGFQPVLTGSV
jgi:hypothetical protein